MQLMHQSVLIYYPWAWVRWSLNVLSKFTFFAKIVIIHLKCLSKRYAVQFSVDRFYVEGYDSVSIINECFWHISLIRIFC